MPKGLKTTSSPITVSFSVTESAANTFTQDTISLQLNVLDREVFVVTGCNLDLLPPDCIVNSSTQTRGSLSSTSLDGVGSLSGSNVIAAARDDIVMEAAEVLGMPFTAMFGEAPAVGMDYLAIIATNDFFIQVRGTNNTNVKSMRGKLYGYRAIADAGTFAALTQSELLSA